MSSKRSLRWRAPDLSRIGFAELRRLDLPACCSVDGLDLDLTGAFTGICVTWPASLGPGFRLEVEARLDRWWNGRSSARPPAALVLVLPRP